MKKLKLDLLFGLHIMMLINLDILEIGEFGNILVKEVLMVYLEMLIWIKLLLIMNLLLKKDILMGIKTYLIVM